MRFRPGLWPTLIALPAFAALLGLGFWQLERLEWKTALIAEREAALARPPAPLPPNDDISADWDFRPVLVRGRFLHDKAQRFGPRLDRPEILTPLVRAEGGAILVNRGAAPGGEPAGEVELGGVLRYSRAPGFFAPEHGADTPLWLWYDIAGLERRLGLDLAPAVLELERPPGVGLTNNHLQYALTWFALAAGLAAVYFASQLRKDPSS